MEQEKYDPVADQLIESLKRELRVEDKMPFGILFNSQFSIFNYLAA